jgi:hypothetical protein
MNVDIHQFVDVKSSSICADEHVDCCLSLQICLATNSAFTLDILDNIWVLLVFDCNPAKATRDKNDKTVLQGPHLYLHNRDMS